MGTQVYQVNSDNPNPSVIEKAARYLVAGKIIAFPTETVYGLGANAFDREAVERIFIAKERPSSDPIIVHIADIDQLNDVACEIPDIALQLASKYWPGPLTLVLRRNKRVPSNVSAGLETVAVRMSSHKIPLAIIKSAGIPIAAPSANLFTRPSATTAQHVLEDLNGRVDIILDGGICTIGLESTVIDLTQKVPVLLRPGGTPLESLVQMLPSLKLRPEYLRLSDNQVSVSPGMLTKHYSPRAKLLLFTGPREQAIGNMRDTIDRFVTADLIVGVMSPTEEMACFADKPIQIVELGSLEDIAGIGRSLFRGMRELDKQGVGFILVRELSREGLGLAIWDRLLRAAEGYSIDSLQLLSPQLLASISR